MKSNLTKSQSGASSIPTAVGILLTLLLSGWPIAAQELSGQIKGAVTDQQGAVISKASITARHVDTNTVYRATTSDAGTFAIPKVRLGRYVVEVEVPNFRRAVVNDVNVQVGGVADLNISMEVGTVQEEVHITAGEAQEVINTSDAELSAVVDDRRVLELPLNGRNASHLALLQAGVYFERASTGQGVALMVHGQRHRSLNISLDGIDTQDNLNRASSIMLDQPLLALSAENVKEFRVVTGVSSAEFSRGGAQISAVTRAGTNDFHGSAFWFHRNTALNANDFFNNAAIPKVERPPLLRHQFGARIGGPIIRDKTFFFFGYQQTRESKGIPVNRTVYTAEARRGIFRFLNGVPTTPGNVAANPGLIRTVNLLSCGSGVQGPLRRDCLDSRFNQANLPSLDPFITGNVFGATPLPNNFSVGDGLNTGGFRFNSLSTTVEHLPAFRLDHRFNNKHAFFGTINYTDRDIQGDFINGREIQYPSLKPLGVRVTHSRGFSGTLTSSLTPTFVNEFRAAMVGGENGFLFNQPFSDTFTLDLNTISDPYDPTNGNEVRDNRTVHIRDSVSWVRGKHQFKGGGEFRDRWLNTYSFDSSLPIGVIDFNRNDNPPGFNTSDLLRIAGGTAISTNDFNNSQDLINNLVGAVGRVTRRFNVESLNSGFLPDIPTRRIYRVREFDAFFQDTWNFRPNLTFNLGLRWEYAGTPFETRGLVLIPEGGFDAVFGISGRDGLTQTGVFAGFPCDPLRKLPTDRTSANAINLITSCANKLIPGSSANGRPLWKNDYNNFGPVVSFAWDPWKNGKTSIRAGYRISYMQDAFSIIEANVANNEGLQVDQRCNPARTGANGCTSNSTLLRNIISSSSPVAAPQPFSLPSSRSILDDATAQDFRTFADDLATPYYQEWTFGIQREIKSNLAVEIRYVGNRGSKLRRFADFNEINIFARDAVSGMSFLDSFIIAKQNLACNRANNAGDRFDTMTFGCSRANPLMDALIAGEPSRLRSRSTLINALVFNAPGEFAYRLSQFEASLPAAGQQQRIPGGSFWGAVLAGRLPANFFVVNPFVVHPRAMLNDGFSTYNSVEIEVRHRFSGGLTLQTNYTYGRALSDYDGNANDLLNATRGSSVRNPRYSTQEIMPRHLFNANWVYELPFGPGKRFGAGTPGPLKSIIRGWQMSGIISWRSGRPLNITSGIGTFHRSAVSGDNTVNLSQPLSNGEIRNLVGKRIINGNVFWFDPCLSGQLTGTACADSKSIAGLFQLPTPGKLGDLPHTVIFGPRRFTFDFSLAKHTKLTETSSLEFRWEVFNAFNNANFGLPVTNITNVNFGRVSNTVTDPRLMQFALKVNF